MKKLIGVFFCALFVFASCRTRESEKTKPAPEVKKSSSAKIVSFLVKKDDASSSFSIDDSTGAIVLTLANDHPLSSNLSALAPEIAISKKATISPASGESKDFSGGKEITYTVTAEDGTVKTYKASVVVLPARGTLVVDSIFICGKKVVANAVTVDKDISAVNLKDIQVNFKGDYAPSTIKMNPSPLHLNKRGDTKALTLSTDRTDRWNAWTSGNINVTRAKDSQDPNDKPLSNDKRMIKFIVKDPDGIIDEGVIDQYYRTVTCTVPKEMDLKKISPIITCSPGAVVTPGSGVTRDFSTSNISPLQYNVKAEDKSDYTYQVTITNGGSRLAEMTKFTVNGMNATINKKNRTVFLVVDGTVKWNKVKPIIEISPDATCSPASMEEKDFTNSSKKPILYTVTSQDGKKKAVYKVTIIQHLSNEALIKKFKVGDVEGKIDNAKGTVTVEVPKNQTLNNIRPEITISDRASINPNSGEEQDFSQSPVNYTVTAEDKKSVKEYVVTVKHKVSNLALITEFKVDGIDGIIDNQAGTITLAVPKGRSLTNIKPMIKVSYGAIVAPESELEKDFSQGPVEYVVTAEDKKTTKKYVVTVTNKKSNVARMASFTVDGKNATINRNDGTIYLEVPFKTNLAEIKPVIVCEDNGTCEYKAGTSCDFSDGKTVNFKVTSEDGKTEVTYVATIKKYPPDSVITVFESKSKKDKNGDLYVVIEKEKNKIERNDVKITYMEGTVEKEIDKEKFTISGDQTTLQGDNGYMTLKIALKLGKEFINAIMSVKIVKTEPQQP